MQLLQFPPQCTAYILVIIIINIMISMVNMMMMIGEDAKPISTSVYRLYPRCHHHHHHQHHNHHDNFHGDYGDGGGDESTNYNIIDRPPPVTCGTQWERFWTSPRWIFHPYHIAPLSPHHITVISGCSQPTCLSCNLPQLPRLSAGSFLLFQSNY